MARHTYPQVQPTQASNPDPLGLDGILQLYQMFSPAAAANTAETSARARLLGAEADKAPNDADLQSAQTREAISRALNLDQSTQAMSDETATKIAERQAHTGVYEADEQRRRTAEHLAIAQGLRTLFPDGNAAQKYLSGQPELQGVISANDRTPEQQAILDALNKSKHTKPEPTDGPSRFPTVPSSSMPETGAAAAGKYFRSGFGQLSDMGTNANVFTQNNAFIPVRNFIRSLLGQNQTELPQNYIPIRKP